MELIKKSTLETSDISKRKLRIALSDYGRFGKMEDPEMKSCEINELYEESPEEHRYGKGVLFRLEELITIEIGETEKQSLVNKSSHLKVTEFELVRTLLN